MSSQPGIVYHLYAGVSGNASGIEVSIDGQASVRAVLGNGYYLVGPVTEAQRAHATLVALDQDEHVIPVYGRQGQALGDDPNVPG